MNSEAQRNKKCQALINTCQPIILGLLEIIAATFCYKVWLDNSIPHLNLAANPIKVVPVCSDTPLLALLPLSGSPVLQVHQAPSAGSPPLCQNSDCSAWISFYGGGRSRRESNVASEEEWLLRWCSQKTSTYHYTPQFMETWRNKVISRTCCMCVITVAALDRFRVDKGWKWPIKQAWKIMNCTIYQCQCWLLKEITQTLLVCVCSVLVLCYWWGSFSG